MSYRNNYDYFYKFEKTVISDIVKEYLKGATNKAWSVVTGKEWAYCCYKGYFAVRIPKVRFPLDSEVFAGVNGYRTHSLETFEKFFDSSAWSDCVALNDTKEEKIVDVCGKKAHLHRFKNEEKEIFINSDFLKFFEKDNLPTRGTGPLSPVFLFESNINNPVALLMPTKAN